MSNPDYRSKLSSITSQLKPGSHLLIVSKTRTAQEIRAYYDLGHRDFGENRVQELLEKAQGLKNLCPDIRWHMIGHLQSNKIPQLFSVPRLWAIHSVDDADLLGKLLKAESRLSHEVRLFLQYNTSREEEKSGFEDYDSLLAAARSIPASSKLKLMGLMTMGTLRTEDFALEARRCFAELTQLKLRLAHDVGLTLESSMGMSQDYPIALDEGSQWIRLGTIMFL